MNLIPWRNKTRDEEGRAISPMSQFRSEMDRLFDRFMRDPWGWPDDWFGGAQQNWGPSLDVTDGEKEVTVRAEVPGVDPKELDITISGDVLTLSGEKKESSERKGENFYHTERRFGSFRRSVQLPASVDPDKVTAEHRNGVVTIRLNKVPGAVPKRIPVKAE